MARNQLGQLLDPAALDVAEGARGRLRVVVVAAWAEERACLDIPVPARVACARCEGGGCDGCGRSGALRTPEDPAARTVRVQLPGQLGAGVAVRLVRPFGEDAAIEQLLVEIVAGAEPSPGVTRLPPPPPPPERSPARGAALALAIVALAAAVATVLAAR